MITIDGRISNKIANVGLLCAAMVVARHVHVTFQNGSQVVMAVFDVAVPMFFVVSGFLIAGRFGECGWWGTAVKKRMRSLLIPYVFWNLLCLVFCSGLTTCASFAGFEFGGEHWMNLGCERIIRALGVNFLKPPELPYLWFVRCLVVFALILPLFTILKSLKWGVVVLTVELIAHFVLPFVMVREADWQVSALACKWSSAVLFFSAGIYLRWNGYWVTEIVRKIPILCLSCLGLVLVTSNVVLGWSGGGALQRIVGVPLLMIILWRFVPSAPWPKWLTRSAFPIYLLHYFVLVMLVGACRVLGLKDVVRMSFAAYLVQVLIAVSCCILMDVGLRKAFPRFSAVIFGGR